MSLFERYLPNPPFKKWGLFQGTAPASSGGQGLFSNQVAATGAGTNSNLLSSTNGYGLTFVSGATNGNNAGWRVNRAMTMRSFNPVFMARFRLPIAAPTNGDYRMFIGFSSNHPTADPTGDDPLATFSGYMLVAITTNTNFMIAKNDGTSSTYTSTGITLDANLHTLILIADEANTRWGWSLDGGAVTYDTTFIPASTTALGFAAETQVATAAAARNIEQYIMFIGQDK